MKHKKVLLDSITSNELNDEGMAKISALIEGVNIIADRCDRYGVNFNDYKEVNLKTNELNKYIKNREGYWLQKIQEFKETKSNSNINNIFLKYD